MSTNKLMEAAAEILSGSKKTATAMPPEKLAGEVEDLGGPTPQNAKPDDDSHKIHASGKAPDNSGKNKASIANKPSAASPDTQLRMNKEEKEVHDDEDEDEVENKKHAKKKMKEDIDSLFADDSTISEDFKTKAATIFEARIFDRVSQIQEELEAEYAGKLEEAVELIESELTEKVDDYLNYVVEQWMEENQLAIESGLRAELAEEFIAGLRNLFAEHYVDVPAEKVDLVDELATKVEELESKLNEEMERNIEFSKALVESHKAEVAREVCEGLTTTQFEKIKSLAESVDYSTEEQYKEKIETIRENYFPSGIKKANVEQLHEQVEDTDNEKKVINDPFVAAVSQAISKTKI
jgi:hypothetical protein